MKCIRCGYCCIAYDVIVPIPTTKKKVVVGAHKPSNTLCWNLSFEDGIAICTIHGSSIYKKSPCSCHTQIGEEGAVCRTGNWMQDEGRKVLVEKKKCPVAVPLPIELKILSRRK